MYVLGDLDAEDERLLFNRFMNTDSILKTFWKIPATAHCGCRMTYFLNFMLFCCFGFGQTQTIHTVNGQISVDDLGFTLPHEHIFSNFGADPETASQYDEEALMNQVVPYLKLLKTMGVKSIFDGTTAHFGRNVALLQRISDTTEIQLITNTGYYGAADDRYVPKSALAASAQQIADKWILEFEEGIAGTGVRPGFIKLAFDSGKPSQIDLKLFEAGALAHLRTGLTLAVHTGENMIAAQRQLEILTKHGIRHDAWIWIHANKARDTDMLMKAARSGAWISLDGVNPSNVEEYLGKIRLFKARGLLGKVLVSHDGNSFPRGGAIREYQAVPEILIPKMRDSGFTEDDIELLTVENPKKAFAIGIKKL